MSEKAIHATLPEDSSAAAVVYLPKSKAAVVTQKDQTTRPIRDKQQLEDGLINGKIVAWGAENDFPQKLIALGRANDLVPETLSKKVNWLYGKGVHPFYLENVDQDGNEVLRYMNPKDNPEVHDWMDRTRINSYLLEAGNDLYWFMNMFPELHMSKDRKMITQLVAQEAAFCRWETMDEKEGRSKFCHINANWPDTKEDYITPVPALDPYNPYRYEALQEARGHKFIYPLSYPTPGKTYYQLVNWYAAEKNGWMAVANAIPQWKKALMKNQITLKYIISVPDYWWEWKYPKWKTMKDKERQEKQAEEYDKFETFLAGSEKAGKSILTTFKYDQHLQKEFPGWRLTPVDNKIKDGMYVEDSQEASAHLLYALGVDPTLVGFSPGKNHTSAGSGSDKRVALNMYLESIQPHRDILTEPLQFISRYHTMNKVKGWPDYMRWKIPYTQSTALNEGKEVKTSM